MEDSPSDDMLTHTFQRTKGHERERKRRTVLCISQGAVINEATEEGRDVPMPSWEIKTY